MANEILPAVESGNQTVYIGRQPTADSDPSLDASDVAYLLSWDAEPDEEVIQRMGISPGGPGHKPVMGASSVPFSGEVEIKCPDISSADDTDRPGDGLDPILYAGQWKLTSDNTDKTHTYVLGRSGSQLGAFYEHVYDEDDAAGVLLKGLDFQVGTTLRWEEGGQFVCGFNGIAKGYANTGDWSDIISALAGGPASQSFSADDPIVAMGATIKLVDLRTNTVYGGGTLASPTNALMLLDFSFDPKMTANAQKGTQALGGIKRVRATRTDIAQTTFTVEQTLLASFNPYDLRHDRAPMMLLATFGHPASPSKTVTFLTYGFLTGVKRNQSGKYGNRLYELVLDSGYPEDATDGTPAVGVSPTQIFVAGTNEGLPLDPTATLKQGIAALQFNDAS